MSSLITSPSRPSGVTRRSLVSEMFTEYIVFADIYLILFIGAQHTFTVTDKYKHKRTLKNWSKPCVWLNNKDPREETQDQMVKDWLNANCIFVNLEHCLYLPEVVIPPMFAPRPAPPSTSLFLPGTIEAPRSAVTPLSYLTPSPFHPPNVPQSPSDISQFTEVGTSAGNITINSQTNYLEDFGPFNYRYQHNLPLK